MACMEWQCKKCGHLEFNNISRFNGSKCPKCGNTTWNGTCDEDRDFKEQAREERMERKDRRGL